ncbi:MAG: UDP-N-acetylmuramoyl-tripeptide--D-alanyl-D-alanine ligase, partial [Patescibacteria group bacterium]
MKEIFKKIITLILRIESQLVLMKYKPKIIAITGSVGKTSTKDAVYAVVSKFADTRKSEKSFNSEIGLPLTILGVPNGWSNPITWFKNIFKGLWLIIYPHTYPKWLVLEVGVGKAGDMKKTASWLKTDVVIVTAIGKTPVHVEFFNSRKHLIEEKSGLIKTLKKDGILILNHDDADVLAMKTKTKNRLLTYGFSEGSDILASEESVMYSDGGIPEGVIFRIDEEGNSLPVSIDGVFGRNHIYAALSALSLAFTLKLNTLTAIDAIKNYEVPPGRMRLLKGINDSMIIDDTYNSSPIACESALKTLGDINPNGRRIAILGDMLELGKHTIEAHKQIGGLAVESLNGDMDVLMIVGPRAKDIKEGALEVGMNDQRIFEFHDARVASVVIKDFINKGDM